MKQMYLTKKSWKN